MKAPVDLRDYLTKLASAQPAPGGGSAAMVAGALGCSLVAMVARICGSSKKYEPVHEKANALVRQSDDLREAMLQLRQRDEEAYAAVVAARGNKAALQKALAEAAAAPLEGAKAALAALRLSVDAIDLGNVNLASDAGCAAEFAHASLQACAYNVRINHTFMTDKRLVQDQRHVLAELERVGDELLSAVRTAVNETLL